jgi:hypothetical protein
MVDLPMSVNMFSFTVKVDNLSMVGAGTSKKGRNMKHERVLFASKDYTVGIYTFFFRLSMTDGFLGDDRHYCKFLTL